VFPVFHNIIKNLLRPLAQTSFWINLGYSKIWPDAEPHIYYFALQLLAFRSLNNNFAKRLLTAFLKKQIGPFMYVKNRTHHLGSLSSVIYHMTQPLPIPCAIKDNPRHCFGPSGMKWVDSIPFRSIFLSANDCRTGNHHKNHRNSHLVGHIKTHGNGVRTLITNTFYTYLFLCIGRADRAYTNSGTLISPHPGRQLFLYPNRVVYTKYSRAWGKLNNPDLMWQRQ